MSARMKSSSAGPDFVRMSRFSAATDAWLCSISSVTMAGSVSIGAGASPAAAPAGTLVRERRDEVAAVEDGLQRVPDQRIGLPEDLQEAARLAGEARRWATSTNSLPPASCIGGSAISWNSESPSGFMGSVIICW